MIEIFQSCLLSKMRLSVVLEGRYTGYENTNYFLIYVENVNIKKKSAEKVIKNHKRKKYAKPQNTVVIINGL